MTCTEEKTQFQPKGDEWKCLQCGYEYMCITETKCTDKQCAELHEDDWVTCDRCGYGVSGSEWSFLDATGKCPHCYGTGEQQLTKKRTRKMTKKAEKSIGLESMRGERVLLKCINYFYEGILEDIDKTDAILTDAGIVYETGPWSNDSWEDRQPIQVNIGVKLQAVEAYMPSDFKKQKDD